LNGKTPFIGIYIFKGFLISFWYFFIFCFNSINDINIVTITIIKTNIIMTIVIMINIILNINIIMISIRFEMLNDIIIIGKLDFHLLFLLIFRLLLFVLN